MLKNFIKTALRNIFRQKTYSLLNLTGLALGIACGLLLSLHIKEELSYEKSIPGYDRIYRMVTTEWSKSHPPLAGEMQKFFPEIENIARFSSEGGIMNSSPTRKAEVSGFFADSSAIPVFGMKAIVGDPVQALSEKGTIVLTQSLSEKLFGKADPVGKQVFFNKDTMFVRAVISDMPENSHLKFDFLRSMPTFYSFVPENWLNSRGWMFGWTYVKFKNDNGVAQARAKFNEFWKIYRGNSTDTTGLYEEAMSNRFQPLADIHLRSNLIQEMGANSSDIYIYILIAVEILILLIACVNFVNLFTTQALKRLKEISVRKILGAQKKQLVFQFLGEAFLLTFIAGTIAVILYTTALPFYNRLTGKDISPLELLQPGNLLILFSIMLFTGLLSGIFPALFVTRFDPASTLKGLRMPGSGSGIVRKGLVVFQFTMAAFLIISTVVIYQQMTLFRNKQLGFDKDQIVVVKSYGDFKDKIVSQPETVKRELLAGPGILSVGLSSNVIGDDLSVESVQRTDTTLDEVPPLRVFRIDENYLDVMNIQLAEGRNFSRAYNDSASFIINETAAKLLGLKKPLGASLINRVSNLQGQVVGVIKDFHFKSLHNQIEPLMLEYKPRWGNNLMVKIAAGKNADAIPFLQKKIEAMAPGTLFSYGFLDEKIAGLYKKEDNISQIMKIFAGLAILISCLGLFGLAAHATESRTKEIGIRKVIGAGMPRLIQLLSKDFFILVLIGNLVAWPLAWYATHKWLQSFTYQATVHWSVFGISAIVTLIIAAATIAWHCIRAANANPVKSLRTE